MRRSGSVTSAQFQKYEILRDLSFLCSFILYEFCLGNFQWQTSTLCTPTIFVSNFLKQKCRFDFFWKLSYMYLGLQMDFPTLTRTITSTLKLIPLLLVITSAEPNAGNSLHKSVHYRSVRYSLNECGTRSVCICHLFT